MKAVSDCLKASVEVKISETETRMVLPRQLQSDRGASIIAQSFLIDRLKVHNTPTRPYSPKAKVIEAALGHFQNEVLRWYNNFAGLNITAKRMDSRYNPDFVHKNRKDVPEWDGLEKQFNEALDTWNNYETKGRKAPNKLYAQKSKGRGIGRLAILDLFWEKRKGTYLYHPDGIHLEYGQREHIYQVLDADFYKQYIRARFGVAFDRDTPGHVYLYQDGQPVIWKGRPAKAVAADLVPMALADMKAGDRERLNRMMAIKDRVKADTVAELEDIRGEHPVHLDARYMSKELFNLAETHAKETDWGEALKTQYAE